MEINHRDAEYQIAWYKLGRHKFNGAYYYSKEICANIIPNVKTDRNWITVKAGAKGADHSICFVHDNVKFEETYSYMRKHKDVIFVVGLPDMVERAEQFGKAIYLPLSVDVKYVKQFRRTKTKDAAIAGRKSPQWHEEFGIPEDTDTIGLLPRSEFLGRMAKYRKVYAIGRTAIEAKILGCEILPFHPRLMDTELWQVLDNKEAAGMLQKMLDEIDGGGDADM